MNKNKTFNVKRDFLIIMAFLWLSSLPICAQNITVRGNVVDEQKEPLIGVTVKIQGTTTGTVTDYDGNFELPNVPPEGKLEFSYVGMKTLIVPVNGRTMINVTMQEDVEMLEEVVITGYGGTQLRSRSTHSIAKVENKKLEVGIFSNPGQALSGAVSGLRVVQYSGNPGATPTIVLRGGTNLDGSGSPLVIVDGQVRGSLSDINPEDIENMQVMKDAGATAIYGARANNGVILIQTKRGKKGVSEMNFKMKVGANYLNLPYEFCNAEEYLTWMRPSYVKSAQIWQRENGTWVGYSNPITLTGTQPYGTGNAYFADDGVTPLENTMNSVWSTMYYEDRYQFLIDKHGWQKMKDPVYEYIKSISKDPNSVPEYLIFRNTYPGDFNFKDPSYSQDYNWNMSGGNDKGSYYTSLGYNYSQGLPVSSYYKRYSITANGDYKIKPWLTSFSNFNFTRANWQSMPPSQTSEANYFSRILTVPPTVRYVNEHDGSYRLGNNYSDGNQAYQPDKFFRLNQTDKFTMNQTLKIDFAKNMNLKLSGNWYYSEGFYEAFNKDFRENPTKINTTRNSSGEFGRTIDQTYNAIFNYDTQINDHYLSVMLGSEYYDTYSYGIYAAGSGAPTDDFRDLGLTSSEENKRFIDSYHTKQRILSFFGRANYNWQEKYLLSLVLRHDGYSRLVNNRWGTFPGISAGWIFSKESFMDELDEILSFGKLRASYGLNGNVSGIGAYELQGSYVASTKYNGLATFVLGSVPNPDLRWEKTRTFEVGLDLSYLNNRYSTNFTFYDRLTSDKFATLSLPCSSGISGIRTNNGEFRNRGVEIELSAIPIQNSNWYWNIGANISYNKNTVVSLPYNGLPLNRQGGFQVYSGKNETDLIWVGGYQEGKEPGVLYAFKAEGIYKDESEIPDDMIVKRHSFQGATTRPSYGKNNWANMSEQEKINSGGFPIQPGDVKWKDVNGDNIIDDFDLVKVGNTTPHWFGGFNTTVTWKKLSLYCAFDYAFDFWVMDYRLPWILGNMQGTYNMTTDVRKTWTPENPKAKYPAYVWADQLGKGNYRNSTLFSYRGDYLSLRQVSLSYSLPRELINKAFIEKLDLSITGQNLGYITAAKTVATPERGGIQDATYTLPRTVIFGLNITF